MRFQACLLLILIPLAINIPAQASDWYPIETGRSWVYTSPDGGASSATVGDPESFAGSLVQPFQWNPGNRECLSQDGTGRVLHHGLTGAPDGTYIVFDPPWIRMDSGLTTDHEWEGTYDVVLYSAEGVELNRGWGRMTFRVIGLGSVEVSAGTFQAAEVVITRESDSLPPYTFREWYAAGVGCIRRTEADGTTLLFELESYGPVDVPVRTTTWGAIKSLFED